MAAYYNEHDPLKSAWLRELMRRNLIAAGEVDERSITEVRSQDLAGFKQCHFFAGIGVWSYALRLAGWPDDSPVWTGSCPCPSFSSGGKRLGFDDPRHLWPAWFRVLSICRPHTVFGEQVASGDGLAWLDVVSSDLEGADYAIGAADLCAAGVGAPHLRQRLYFVADTERGPAERYGFDVGRTPCFSGRKARQQRLRTDARNGSDTSGLGNTEGHRRAPAPVCGAYEETASKRKRGSRSGERCSAVADGVLHPVSEGLQRHVGNGNGSDQSGRKSAPAARSTRQASADGVVADTICGGLERSSVSVRSARQDEASPIERRTSCWSAADWIPCADGKARPVEPGTFPLAHGAPARVVRLRGYGDAIVAPLAQAFIEAYQKVRFAA